ncbi:nuclear transport factor 2 family protein [Bradyrhizobium sp. BR2003]|uniref:Nuclear transport factor 2 family protein n=1 Tax=Bradyrhizobium elkanii TaxID=29448 RepID=A0A4U6S0Z8_BRAEL|nr:nuclear transport factor 2 family protein [Bradyrhizobium sp. BR2003]MTV14084.1 nuclear transport factor 2 family protein [Bradyrhizobium sp. BR2003]TKV80393.1 nuclear transport factor 2 family protein [Bradyrhizobium elkanii]
MSCDPMAATVNWLDAYRAGDLEEILGMFADNAVIHCDCGGQKTLTGKNALRAYWLDRLKRYPAFGLNDLKPKHGDVAISYITTSGIVGAVLTFDATGRIKSVSCGPAVRD